MKEILVSIIQFKNHKRIKLQFDYDQGLVRKIKKLPDCRWDADGRFWHIHYIENHVNYLNKMFEGEIKFIEKGQPHKISEGKDHNLKERQDILRNVEEYLIRNRYSENTRKIYFSMAKSFFNFHSGKPPLSITRNDILIYNSEYIIRNGLSPTYQNQLISVLKLIYNKLYSHNIDFKEIERPRKARKLPVVLSKEEVRDLLDKTKNIKHRAILSTLYSLGIRKSELINLQVGDIDSGRMMVHVRGGKGNKDRYLGLSEKLLGLLQEY